MRTLSIVGARPQFVKLAPVSREMARCSSLEFEDVILHTGQHYDEGMSDIFFGELEIPEPEINLGIGSGSHGWQTGQMLEKIEHAIESVQPDLVITYGDTNSTIAGALAAAKLHKPQAHIEAGLRSFNREMPEEINRIVTDHIADLLFAPTETARRNLQGENLEGRTHLVGDVMLDAVLHNLRLAADKSTIRRRLELDGTTYAVATIHRPSNTDTPLLAQQLAALNRISERHLDIVFPMHPRTRARIREHHPGWVPAAGLHVIDPVGYLDILALIEGARLVLTDSGGLQKEAFFVGTPCVTLRRETEWIETVEAGANVLVGVDAQSIESAVMERLDAEVDRAAICNAAREAFGAGKAAQRIVDCLVKYGTASHSDLGTSY